MNRRQLLAVSLLPILCCALGVQAQTKPGSMVVDQAWVRVLPDHPTEANVYLTMTNHGDRPDRLLSASSDDADEVAVQRTIWRGLTPKLDSVANLQIRSGKQVEFAPGGYQITLKNLRQPLAVGQSVKVILNFAVAGRVEIQPKVANHLLGNRK